MTTWDRVKAKCVRLGDCLVWQGSVTNGGYGQITVNGQTVGVHRIAYEHANGPIPEGYSIDHVKARGCAYLTCCNADHLEAVTPRVNVLRGDTITARNAAKSHCPKGHPLSGDNVARFKSSGSRRRCLSCRRAARSEWGKRRTEARRQAVGRGAN